MTIVAQKTLVAAARSHSMMWVHTSCNHQNRSFSEQKCCQQITSEQTTKTGKAAFVSLTAISSLQPFDAKATCLS